MAVELDGTPVPLVADQQGALLQTALAVRLGWHTQLGDVARQVLLHCGALGLRPRPLQHPSLTWEGERERQRYKYLLMHALCCPNAR